MSDQPKQIYGLMAKIMAEVGPIAKERRNANQNYSFRGIDELYNALNGVMSANGVFVVPQVVSLKTRTRTSNSGTPMIHLIATIKHVFYAPDGSSVEAVTLGESMDSGDKACNKCMSAAIKYALIESFCIPTTGDNDTENHNPQLGNRRRKPDLNDSADPFRTKLERMMPNITRKQSEESRRFGEKCELTAEELYQRISTHELGRPQATTTAELELVERALRTGKYSWLTGEPVNGSAVSGNGSGVHKPETAGTTAPTAPAVSPDLIELRKQARQRAARLETEITTEILAAIGVASLRELAASDEATVRKFIEKADVLAM